MGISTEIHVHPDQLLDNKPSSNRPVVLCRDFLTVEWRKVDIPQENSRPPPRIGSMFNKIREETLQLAPHLPQWNGPIIAW